MIFCYMSGFVFVWYVQEMRWSQHSPHHKDLRSNFLFYQFVLLKKKLLFLTLVYMCALWYSNINHALFNYLNRRVGYCNPT